MSVTVELNELDADLWDAFKRGGAWVAHSEYMKLKAENAKLRELVADLWMQLLNAYDRKEVDEFADRMRELGIEVD